MSWSEVTTQDWLETVSDGIEQLGGRVSRSLARFKLAPRGFEGAGAIHDGPLLIDGDFTPPSQITAVFGDLEVNGRISLQGVDGADGDTTLLVLGRLTCATLVSDWASLILVSQDVNVSEWAMTSFEDSSFVVGGDFNTPLFIGYDIWVTVGGTARMKAGIGYARQMDANGEEETDRAIRPQLSEEETMRMLRMGEDDWLEDRLHETGTILPPKE